MGTTPRRILSRAILLVYIFAFIIASCAAGGLTEHQLGWIPGRQACRGTIAECIAGDEFDLAIESSRRILATSSYISYEALKRGSVPCSRRGASYYNCRAGAQANPYSRGCSAITQCRT
ncbi:hypothetical protein HPP92_001896 [Vanilla planifolia]|uniref:Uncharacterized protein n=1 Tax=Vanilla planifolia TaxID=51239 RepID=A0A835S5E2_VANPL|nr:hypothetical protein HPP92_002143 [Vanilla planifolia]KAG0501824.1 hypothetical protein HPP92_001896 [Vanilla planifolia]